MQMIVPEQALENVLQDYPGSWSDRLTIHEGEGYLIVSCGKEWEFFRKLSVESQRISNIVLAAVEVGYPRPPLLDHYGILIDKGQSVNLGSYA